MNVVDLCPVGALTSKDFRFHKRVWFLKPDDGICSGCARGCNIYVDHHKDKYKKDEIFRYRPRFNDNINGYFICDYGRLSYKQENLNLEAKPSIRGKESEYEYSMMKVLRLLKHHHGKAIFLISASLSLEELYIVKKLSYRYDAKLYEHSSVCDEAFSDNFLKVSDKEANKQAVNLLGISTNQDEKNKSINKAEVIVLFGKSEINMEGLEEKSVICLSASEPKNKLGFDVYLPIATHSLRNGTFINCDGYAQFNKSTLTLDREQKCLLTLVSFYLEENHFTCKDIWEEGLSEIMGDITYEKIQLESIKMDIL